MRWALLLVAGCTRVLGVHDFEPQDASPESAPPIAIDAPPDADASGLLAHLSFDGPDLGHDVSGHGHDATCTGSCEATHGIVAGSVRFDGNSTMTVAAAFPDSTFTIAAWVLVQTIPQKTQCAFARPYGAGLASVALCIDSMDGKALAFHFEYAPTPTTEQSFTFSNASLLGFWQHVAMTWDGGQLRVFHNGQQLGGSQSGIVLDDSPMTLAKGLGAQKFAGELDELYVYGRVLSDDEIMALYTH